MESNDCRMHYYGMFKKPDDRELLSHRARRYIRGIAVAMTLTFAALLFLAATLYGSPLRLPHRRSCRSLRHCSAQTPADTR